MSDDEPKAKFPRFGEDDVLLDWAEFDAQMGLLDLLGIFIDNDAAGHIMELLRVILLSPIFLNFHVLGRCACSCRFLRDQMGYAVVDYPSLPRWRTLRSLWAAGDHFAALQLLVPVMMLCSPGADAKKIRRGMKFCRNNGVVGKRLLHWDLSDCKLTALPEEFCILFFEGFLHLNRNQLVSLPLNFGDIQAFALMLSDNLLKSLPDGFGRQIPGHVVLYNNNLTSLPDSFSLALKGCLDLSHNHLESLPHGFGTIKVGQRLDFSYNRLKSLPPSFAGIQVGHGLCLNDNRLESLPDGFGQNVGGTISLACNAVKFKRPAK